MSAAVTNPGPSVSRLASALATYWTRADRLFYTVAAVLFASGLCHLLVQAIVGGPWDGPVSWRKPTTFGVAFGLTLATITWVTTFIAIRPRVRARLLTVFAIACVAEVSVITVQAWRHVPSHFNVSSPVNSLFAYTAAGGGGILIITTIVFARAAYRANPAVPPSMRLAVRAGFVAFLCALAIGAFMIVLGVRETRTVSQAAAYTVAAAFKSGHAATMHGILILPALAWLGSFADWPEARRIRVIALACLGYFLAAGVVVVDTFVAVNPLALTQAPLIDTTLAGAGMLLLLTAIGLTLAGLRRTPLAAGLVSV
jgi:hypothetical protein